MAGLEPADPRPLPTGNGEPPRPPPPPLPSPSAGLAATCGQRHSPSGGGGSLLSLSLSERLPAERWPSPGGGGKAGGGEGRGRRRARIEPSRFPSPLSLLPAPARPSGAARLAGSGAARRCCCCCCRGSGDVSAGGWEGAGNAGHSSANSPLLPRFALGRGGPGKGGGGGHRRPGRARPRCPQAVRGGLGAAGLRPETPASLTELFPSRSGPSVPVRASPCPVVVPPPPSLPVVCFCCALGPLSPSDTPGSSAPAAGGVVVWCVCLSVCPSIPPCPLEPRPLVLGAEEKPRVCSPSRPLFNV